MYASFENVKESGLSVGRRVGRRLSCRRLKTRVCHKEELNQFGIIRPVVCQREALR